MLSGRGFLTGLITGSVLGTVLGGMLKPQRKPDQGERLMGQTRRMRAGAKKMAEQVSDGVNNHLLQKQR